jgi:lysozyme
MRTSDKGCALIWDFEDCRLRAYPDPKTGGAPWTCGRGTTRGVTPDTVWTQAKADDEARMDLAEAELLVEKYVTAPMTQGQYDAFVSIFQNVGPGRKASPGDPGRDGIACLKNGNPSTLLRKFNAGDVEGCCEEWLKWISPGSTVAEGLLRRRKAELVRFREED